MVLSFHPNIVADQNILCAGRQPNDEDRAAICQARAVILSQGCRDTLYRMCRKHCVNVFPNYDVRYDYPGKLGQSRLFQKAGAPFPRTYTFETVSSYFDDCGHDHHKGPLGFPCVFKFDWGGEGEQVFLVQTDQALKQILQTAQSREKGGQRGFLLQEYIPCGGRSLRTVVIGDELFSYWQVQQAGTEFLTNLAAGAVIDHESDSCLQDAGKAAVKDFCLKTGINLAGFDLLFSVDEAQPGPVFLEINYFFGRRGFGGSLKYYDLVEKAVRLWLESIGLGLVQESSHFCASP